MKPNQRTYFPWANFSISHFSIQLTRKFLCIHLFAFGLEHVYEIKPWIIWKYCHKYRTRFSLFSFFSLALQKYSVNCFSKRQTLESCLMRKWNEHSMALTGKLGKAITFKNVICNQREPNKRQDRYKMNMHSAISYETIVTKSTLHYRSPTSCRYFGWFEPRNKNELYYNKVKHQHSAKTT